MVLYTNTILNVILYLFIVEEIAWSTLRRFMFVLSTAWAAVDVLRFLLALGDAQTEESL